jgi:hypothetical protein
VALYSPLQLQQSIEDHNRQAQPGQDIVFSFGAVAYDKSRHAGVAEPLAEADALMYEQKRRRHAEIDNNQGWVDGARAIG